MSAVIYVLCTLTSLACAWLLLSRYKDNGHRLLFWSGLCFSWMTLNNLILLFDKLLLPDTDLQILRQVSALVAVSMLVYGLIYEKD